MGFNTSYRHLRRFLYSRYNSPLKELKTKKEEEIEKERESLRKEGRKRGSVRERDDEGQRRGDAF